MFLACVENYKFTKLQNIIRYDFKTIHKHNVFHRTFIDQLFFPRVITQHHRRSEVKDISEDET